MSEASLEQVVEKFGATVETLFKVEGPFQTAQHGFQGVLLRNAEDLIHCHICGEWKGMLGPHVFWKHDLTSDEYRKMFGLPLEFPLCGRGISARRSARSLTPEHLARLRKLGKKYRLKGKKLSRRLKRSMSYSKTSAAHENKHGACEAQILKRYLIVSDTIGKPAGQNDLVEHDDALRGIINRKYGNLNTFREKHGFETVAKAPIKSDEELISEIRKYHQAKGDVPRPVDFGARAKVIRERFGSWRKALAVAGFEPGPRYGGARNSFLSGG